MRLFCCIGGLIILFCCIGGVVILFCCIGGLIRLLCCIGGVIKLICCIILRTQLLLLITFTLANTHILHLTESSFKWQTYLQVLTTYIRLVRLLIFVLVGVV